MSDVVIFDTSVLVDQLRTGRHTTRIQGLRGLVRNSAVVLAELWRGASSPAEHKFLSTLQKNHPILLPSLANWLESGQLLGKLRTAKGFSSEKLRTLHFDVLIALTTRSHGARLITSNRADFELIAAYCPLRLEVWS
jgi:predicted nucleic acid-binding protein